MNSSEMLLEKISDFSRVKGYKVNILKLLIDLHTSNNQKRKIKGFWFNMTMQKDTEPISSHGHTKSIATYEIISSELPSTPTKKQKQKTKIPTSKATPTPQKNEGHPPPPGQDSNPNREETQSLKLNLKSKGFGAHITHLYS